MFKRNSFPSAERTEDLLCCLPAPTHPSRRFRSVLCTHTQPMLCTTPSPPPLNVCLFLELLSTCSRKPQQSRAPFPSAFSTSAQEGLAEGGPGRPAAALPWTRLCEGLTVPLGQPLPLQPPPCTTAASGFPRERTGAHSTDAEERGWCEQKGRGRGDQAVGSVQRHRHSKAKLRGDK